MSSIYVQLALLALTFSCFGFLLHAFYFGGSRQKHLTKELSEIRKDIENRERELRQAEEATQKADRVIQSLEKQLQQKAIEMEHLKQLATRQDKAIELLQKEAEFIRAAMSGSAKSVKSVQEALSAVSPVPQPPMPIHVEALPVPSIPVQEPQQRSHQEISPVASAVPGHGTAPAWKENLDNIISILDTMEKEVEK
jgi:TolA-binding protein